LAVVLVALFVKKDLFGLRWRTNHPRMVEGGSKPPPFFFLFF